MSFVYYLCFSNSSQRRGLVFPYELEKDIYSPGIWIVNCSIKGNLDETYVFETIVNREILECKMERVNRTVFKVNTENHGSYFFRLIRMIPSVQNEYIGENTNLKKKNGFYQVVPMHVETLERACHELGLFFVGRAQ